MTIKKDFYTHLAEVIEPLTILKRPEYHLVHVLDCFTKDNLVDLAYNMGRDHIRISHKKAKIVSDLTEVLMEDFTFDLEYLTREQHQALMMLSSQKKMTVSIQELPNYLFLFPLIEDGKLFLFNWEHMYHFVLPEEMNTLTHHVFSHPMYQKELNAIWEILDVIRAMIHLYGAFEADRFIDVWAYAYPEKMLFKNDYYILLDIMNERQDFFHYRNELIYSNYLDLRTAKELIKATKERVSYLPSAKEINLLKSSSINENTPGYDSLFLFLSSFIPSVLMEEVKIALEAHVLLSMEPEDFLEDLIEIGVDPSFIKKNKERVYHLLGTVVIHSPQWLLKGGKLIDEKPQLDQKSSKSNIIPFPNDDRKPQPIRTEKVGRNDPCPCGSGKKYKRCHGK